MVSFVELAIGFVGGGGVTFLVAQRKLRSESVTAERTKWREKIRGFCLEAVNGGNPKLWTQLAVNLNPTDDEDTALVRAVRKLNGTPPSDWDTDEIVGRFALLLKHDWERAKLETSFWPFKWLRWGDWYVKADRENYSSPRF